MAHGCDGPFGNGRHYARRIFDDAVYRLRKHYGQRAYRDRRYRCNSDHDKRSDGTWFCSGGSIGTIVFAVQKFIGTPLASYFGLKEARFLIDEYRKTGVVPQDTYAPKKESAAGPTFFEGHKKYYGQFTCLAITALFSWIAFVIGKWTGLSATIWALILGAAVGSTGYLPRNILKHANAGGLLNCAVFCAIIPSLATINRKTPDAVLLDLRDLCDFDFLHHRFLQIPSLVEDHRFQERCRRRCCLPVNWFPGYLLGR